MAVSLMSGSRANRSTLPKDNVQAVKKVEYR